jgi:hypothetical protein
MSKSNVQVQDADPGLLNVLAERVGRIFLTLSQAVKAAAPGIGGNVECIVRVTPVPADPEKWEPSANWKVANGSNGDKSEFRVLSIGGFSSETIIRSLIHGIGMGHKRFVAEVKGGPIPDFVTKKANEVTAGFSPVFLDELESFVRANGGAKKSSILSLVALVAGSMSNTIRFSIPAPDSDETRANETAMLALFPEDTEILTLHEWKERVKLENDKAKLASLTPEQKERQIKSAERKLAALRGSI